jgi:hypothetical protein
MTGSVRTRSPLTPAQSGLWPGARRLDIGLYFQLLWIRMRVSGFKGVPGSVAERAK